MTGGPVAVGYRFDTADWPKPGGLLKPSEPGDVLESKASLELPTSFTDASGRGCGKQVITFLKTGSARGSVEPPYFLSTDDLLGLLRIISSCATRRQ